MWPDILKFWNSDILRWVRGHRNDVVFFYARNLHPGGLPNHILSLFIYKFDQLHQPSKVKNNMNYELFFIFVLLIILGRMWWKNT